VSVIEIDADGSGQEPRRNRRSQVVTAAVALAVVVLAVLAVVTQRLSSQTASTHRHTAAAAASYLAGPAALAAAAAAKTETQATLTYNYKTLTTDFAAAEKGLTPSFRVRYQSTTAASVTPLATKYHAVSMATISAGGVSTASADSATILLFVDQTVQNSQLAHPRLDRSRIKVSMVKTDGRWLIEPLAPG
jgi:Mce-associated membrane protein